MEKALQGLRVVDLSQLLAAPQVSGLLADFGADVVKVEPPGGDPLRSLGLRIDDSSAPYLLANRGKRRLVLDVADELDVLRSLLVRSDVVVCNQPRPVLERWGCTPEQLHELNPRLVVVTVSCYGASGPRADSPGNGTLAEAFAGLTHLTGQPDGPPMLSAAALGDNVVALAGAFGAMAACWHRDVAGGEGQHVDVSMFEPVLMLLGPTLAGWDPAEEPPRRNGSRIAGGAPRNVYQALDGRHLVLSGTTDQQVARVLQVLGLDRDDRRLRYGTSDARLVHADELDADVARWIGRHTRDEALARFTAARVPVAPVNDFRDLLDDPQVVARGSLVRLDRPRVGPRVVPGPPVLLRGTPGVVEVEPMADTSPAEVLDRWR